MIGASGSPEKWGFIVLFNVLKGNYRGTVYPVNPHQKSILGLTCYPSVRDIPGTPDVAIITTPARTVPSLIDECGQKGIPYAVVVTADFSETGAEGVRLEAEIVEKARSYGMRVVGPNMMGIFSARTNLHALMPPVMPLHGPISMFSQSGNVGTQMLFWGINEGIGFEKFVSSGNEADLSCVDYLRYFANDETTRVIMTYLEGLAPDSGLFSTAKEVSHKKPIIVFKGGRTETGGRAAASHSGALAGSSRLFKSALRQAGMIEVATSQELMDCAKAFTAYPVPRGNRVAILTRGGGWGVITADACEENGLVVSPLPEDLIKKFDAILPKYWSHANPIDMVATNSRKPYMECLELLAHWDGVDSIIALGGSLQMKIFYSKEVKGPKELVDFLAFAEQATDKWSEETDIVAQHISRLVHETGKPIFSVTLGFSDAHKTALEDYQVISYPTAERAVRILKLMADYRRFLDSPA